LKTYSSVPYVPKSAFIVNNPIILYITGVLISALKSSPAACLTDNDVGIYAMLLLSSALILYYVYGVWKYFALFTVKSIAMKSLTVNLLNSSVLTKVSLS